MRISFRIKLLASHAAVALAVSAVTLLVVERAVSSRMEAQIDRRLEAQAEAVAQWRERPGRSSEAQRMTRRSGQEIATRSAGRLDRLARRLAGVVSARVTIVDATGSVGESQGDGSARGGTWVQTPEFVAARAGEVGRVTRYSGAEKASFRYVAVPAADGSVVRLGLRIDVIDETKRGIRRQLGVGVLVSLIVALTLATLVAAAMTRRLHAARRMAERMGAGDYEVTVADESRDAIGVLSRTLATAAGKLEATETRRREFLANVAHEIRTPVTSIRGYAETLASAQVDPETQGEFLQTIHRNSLRIGRLIEDLLELEALQAGKSRPLAAEPTALAPIVKHVTETLQARASELDAEITTELPPDLSPRGDTDAIERILLNLVDNALRYGGSGVSVAISARQRGEHIAVLVTDNGPGIPHEQRSQIFERFHRAAAGGERDQGGSGLGLPISRELAQAMGGTLQLSDSDEPGTTFCLQLPG